MQRSRQDFTAQFYELFGKHPRSSQEAMFIELEKHCKGSEYPLVIEAPTGVGKSFIGFFMGNMIETAGRIMYVCSHINLQTQCYNDAMQYFDSVGILFGKGKISSIMGDLAKGIKSFKKGMSDENSSKDNNNDNSDNSNSENK